MAKKKETKLEKAQKFAFEFMFMQNDCGGSSVQDFAENDEDWEDEDIDEIMSTLKKHYKDHDKCYG